MPTITVDNIVKTFGAQRAVDGVSFDVEHGEIFGLLGPNGAGKTTSLRIILDIFKPDSGKVAILGGPMDEKKKDLIGYLPEERGLYQDIQLERCLLYLASLKGLAENVARKRIGEYLERFDLATHRRKKLKELSKGMQQKAQLIVTLVHDPQMIIIDEPFAALDPVNTQMVKDLLRDERERGKTIVMCTHQMNQVEELCDRLVLINQGKVMLYGTLEDIRRRYAARAVIVSAVNELPASLPGVTEIIPQNHHVRLNLAPGSTPQDVLRALVERNVAVEHFEIATPTLDEIFIRVVQGEGVGNE
ncbi:MAG TPA: ATP-binding cassette domain-containing protein [Anaerolineaceae bacterium]|nr:ATP-binding cassette domain-containing protein [Anaerolineaceae bacterium]